MSTLSTLVRHRGRRDRVQLAIWVVSTGLLALSSASAIAKTYGDLASREAILRLAVANPAILLLRGLPQGASLAAFIFFQIFTYLALLAGFMSTFLAVRHSRAEEETGRAESVAATPAGRTLPTVATAVHGVLANLVLGTAVALCFIGGRLNAHGSLVAGVSVAATGIAFLGVGLVAAQVVRSSRGANGVSAAIVGAAFLLRGVGDAMGTPSPDGVHLQSSWLSWLSPIGWGQHSAAFTANTFTPLLLDVGLALLCGVIVFTLQARRDTGASLLAGRPGRVNAPLSLSTSFGLAWRQSWPTIVGWCVGGAACGVFAGTLTRLATQASAGTPQVGAALHRMVPGAGASIEQVLVAAVFALVGVLAAACATQMIIRMRQDEASGTVELVLTTPLSRVRWLADQLLLGLVAVALVLLSAAVASGVSAVLVGAGADLVTDSLAAAAAQLPAALVYLALLALVFVIMPRVTIGLGWTLVGVGAFLGVFGGLIGVPRWAIDLAPFAHTPVLVGPSTDWSGGVAMLGLAVGGAVLASVAMRHRELQT